jgi:hypothetical protein
LKYYIKASQEWKYYINCHGFMSNDKVRSYTLIKAGKNHENWFTNQDLFNQFQGKEDTNNPSKTIVGIKELIEELHPGCRILVAFDNSMTHHAKSPDGLDVYRLKLSDSMTSTANGVFMKSEWYLNAHGTRIEQSMQDANGIQKGVRTILRERGKFQSLEGHDLNLHCHPCKIRSPRDDPDYARIETCCASYVLSQEPDLKVQVEWLTEVVQAAGFDITFYLKYHCELNYIEMVWAWVKSHHRRNCTYNFKDLERDLPKTLTELMPLSFV